MGTLSELPSPGNVLYGACLAYCTITQRLSGSTSKLLEVEVRAIEPGYRVRYPGSMARLNVILQVEVLLPEASVVQPCAEPLYG